ncbi:MAG: amino acid adenylation domain-containing protein [Lachnospiraceae bacterium]|nr:amino acid adenylation domain-containing protein [Lachnospiraceae bacterium]
MEKNEIKELIAYCQRNGMKLWTEDGKLKYKAQEAFLKSGILAQLKENKEGLIAYLENARKEESLVQDRAGRYEPFLLSDVQSAYVLGRNHNFAYGGVACHNYMELNYDKLDPAKVEEIFTRLIARHDMLRAVMHEDGYQQILRNVPAFHVKVLDENATDAQIEACRYEMSHKVYELGKAPMFSVAITQRENKSILHFSIEFLIADWTSVWMILSEFETLYFEPEADLGEIGVSFRDYLLTEKRLSQSEKAAADRAYWMAKMEDFPEAPKLPIQKESEAEPEFERKSLSLDSNQWSKLKKKANAEGVTPTALVMSVYGEVLRRWSTQKDFAINMTVLNRKQLHEDILKVVGDFTTLALIEMRTKGKNQSFLERVRDTNKTIFESLDHSDFSGVEMIRELGRRNGREASMMPYVFTSAIGLLGNGLKGRFEGMGISQTPQVFIDCQAMDSADGLRVNWDIRKGVFEGSVAEDMFTAFAQLLNAIAGDTQLSELTVELPQYQVSLWKEFNETGQDIAENLLYSDFIQNAKKNPAKIACADENSSYSYEQLLKAACGVASKMKEKGFRQGECAAVLMEKGCEQAVAALGILFAGGVYVPVDSKTDSYVRRDKILTQAGIRFAVTQKEIQNLPDGVEDIVIGTCKEAGPEVISRVQPSDPAYVIFTSGTTGEPKGVVIPHKGAFNTIRDLNQRYGVTEKDSVLGLSEFNFDLSVYDLFGMLSAGGTVYYPQQIGHMNPGQWEQVILKHKITMWNSVPALMQMFVSDRKLKKAEKNLPIRLVFLSGDWIPVDLPTEIEANCVEVQIICMGGATEASIWSNFHVAQEDDRNRVSIPYGRPLANQRFYVLDSENTLCPMLVPGQLFIGGKGVALGYLNDETLTAEKFVPEFESEECMYATGDMGRMLENGELEFLGRMDHQVKVRGYRIELGEIEHAFTNIEGIDRAVARMQKDKVDLPIQVVAEISKEKETQIREKEEKATRIVEVAEAIVENRLKQEAEFDYKAQKIAQEQAAYLSMLWALQELSIKTRRDVEESKVIKKEYKWVLKHWIEELGKAGFAQALSSNTSIVWDEVEKAWQETKQKWKDCYGSPVVLDYYLESARHLIEVCKGEIDPIGILYPDGADLYTKSLYVENRAAIGMSQSIIEIIAGIRKENPGKKLRILEIGAGTAATAVPVIKSLEGCNYEYHFTDISRYFFKDASEKFKKNENVQIYEFDLNKPIEEQGMTENYFDVIIAAYVLNNVKDIHKSILKMEQLAAPGAIVMFSEPLKTEIPLMICQAFLMTKAEDKLRENQTFIHADQWISELEHTDFSGKVHLIPSKAERMKELGAGLYIKQMKTNYATVDRDEISKSLREQLTEYMIPQAVEYVTEIPLTANGKVDRKKAFEGRFVAKQIVKEEDSLSDLEKSLKEIWETILQVENLGKNQNLYDFGADSLVMAQSVTRMKKELDIDISFDVLLRRLLNFPTIKDLAAFIEKKDEASEGPEIQENQEFFLIKSHGGDAKDGIRVLLHGALGTVECYQNLIPHLVKQNCGEVLSISIVNMEKYRQIPSEELMRELADVYAKAILDRKPAKVQMIGYSFSGSIAIEIARRLSENDIDVASLVIIDGGTLPVTVKEHIVYEWLFIDSMKLNLVDLGFTTENLLEKAFLHMSQQNKKQLEAWDFREVLENQADLVTFEKLMKMEQLERMEYYGDLMERKGFAGFRAALLDTYCENFKHSFAALTFLPELYFGDIRYLSSRDKEGAYGHFNLLLEQWMDICIGEFDQYEIPGDHYSCVEGKENAKILAGYLGWNEVQEYQENNGSKLSFKDLENKFTKEELAEAWDISETMVCYVMMHHLQSRGVLLEGMENTEGEIFGAAKANAKGAKVIARWLRELEAREYVAKENGTYRALMQINDVMVSEMIARRAKAWDGVIGNRLSGEYLESNIRQLDGLIQGKANANFILFPEGSLDYASALYKSTIIFQYLNSVLAYEICKSDASGKRLLEVGAGTGATTDVVLALLAEKQQQPHEYIYTDISKFFLNKAMERYEDISYIHYKVLDLDQEMKEEKTDYIIANGVLNNVSNLKKTLSNLGELLTKEGKLFIVEPARESLEILVSQAFMMSDTEDIREEENQTFMDHEQWKRVLEESGLQLMQVYPESDSPMEVFGQKLYIAGRRK